MRPAAIRSAYAIGVVGRIGEALLEELVGAERYAAVFVATRGPLRSALGKLRPSPLNPQSPDLGTASPIDDVYCCIDLRPGFFGRDQAYLGASATDLPAIARLARASGAQRFVLIVALSPLDQLSAPEHGVRDYSELGLVGAGFETLVFLRPADEGHAGSGRAFERIVLAIGKALIAYLIPQSMQPLRPQVIARAALNAIDSLGPGVHVLNAPAIRKLLKPEARRAAPGSRL
jgi:hypothetical protein